MKKIVHIITGLGSGGAENFLYKLLKNVDLNKYNVSVISLKGKGFYGEKIEKLGIPVFSCNMTKNPISIIKTIIKLYKKIRGADVLQCWMYHANLIGFISGKLAHVPKIIFSIHHANFDKDKNKKLTIIINKICSYLAHFIYAVVYAGENSKLLHINRMGYPKSNAISIPNGVETNKFKPKPWAKDFVSKITKTPKDKNILLVVSKWHPIKDIPNFIEAFKIVNKNKDNVVAILCGRGLDSSNKELVNTIENKNLENEIRLLGVRDDIDIIMAGSDILVLPSAGEAFPMVLIESMACGVPCVATDVGDSRLIVKDTGVVVPPHQPEKLAQGILSLLESTTMRKKLGIKSRQRVLDNYDLRTIYSQYEDLWS